MSTDDKKDEIKVDDAQSSEKRKTLRKLLEGGSVVAGSQVLPIEWTKPVINSIIVPAHAKTSPSPTGPTSSPTTASPTAPTSPTTGSPTTAFPTESPTAPTLAPTAAAAPT